jgi:predicted DsbA family dithiol-disulfide isomerase
VTTVAGHRFGTHGPGKRHLMSDVTGAAVPRTDFAIVVYSDVGCPWANVAVERLSRTLLDKGLDREIGIDHRAFPLELMNDRPIPSDVLNAEIPTLRELEPSAPWPDGPGPWRFTTSTIVALEAVQAAKEQGVEASVRLDRAFRRAVFHDLAQLEAPEHVIEIAREVDGIDVDALEEALRAGRGRAEVHRHAAESKTDLVAGSPTLVLPDGSAHHNPGISMHWEDRPGERLVIDSDDPDVYTGLVERSLAAQPSD